MQQSRTKPSYVLRNWSLSQHEYRDNMATMSLVRFVYLTGLVNVSLPPIRASAPAH